MATLLKTSESRLVQIPLLLLYAGLFVLAAKVIYRLYCVATTPLNRIPGPFAARFTRYWYYRKIQAGNFEKTNAELHKRYGKIVRISPNEYSINDDESLKTIYGHATAFTKTPWYRASGDPNPNVHNIFTEENPKSHAAIKRKVAHLYSMTTLMEFEPYVADCVHHILQKFDQFARQNETINMQHWLQCYAFDAIGIITLNKRFGFLDNGDDKGGLMASLHSYLSYLAPTGVYYEWHPLLHKLASLRPAGGMIWLGTFTRDQIKQREALASEKDLGQTGMRDFLTKSLAMHKADPERFEMKDVFGTCMTNIGAGSDTTSISLAAICYYLAKSPQTVQKLRAEIDEKMQHSSPSELITFSQTQSMPYLQACIKEALRMHPATGLPLSRVVPKGGSLISGQFFPEGTFVGVNTWVIQRNTEIFGPDANQFRPERWLENSERTQRMERSYMPFGLGSRTCIGKNISLLEIAKLIPEVVRRFDMELANPNEELKTLNLWFVKQKNFYCKIRPRKTDQ